MAIKTGTTLPVRYSFSGSDIKGYWILPSAAAGKDTREIESLSTLSVQIYEPVGRARALGFRGVKGFASSVREIAGSMILTVINDHPLIELIDLTKNNSNGVKWSKDLENGFGVGNPDSQSVLKAAGLSDHVGSTMKIGTLIPVFDIFLHYVSEYVDNTVVSEFSDWVNKENTGKKQAKANFKTSENEALSYLNQQKAQTEKILGMLNKKGKSRYNQQLLKDLSAVQRGTQSTGLEFTAEDLGKEWNWKNMFNKDEIAKDYTVEDFNTELEKLNNMAQGEKVFNMGSYDSKDPPPDQSSVGLYIAGVKIISEGIVSSVNDMVTEMTFQFIASDVKTISRKNQMLRSDTAYMQQIESLIRNPNKALYELSEDLEKMRKSGQWDGDIEYVVDGNGDPTIVISDGWADPASLGFQSKGKQK